MINLRLSTNQNLVVLSSDDMPAFKNGTPIITLDRAVMILYTRDINWLHKQIQERLAIGELTVEALKDITDRMDQRDHQMAENAKNCKQVAEKKDIVQ